MSDSVAASIVLGVLKTITSVYDVISFPVYSLYQHPWTKRGLDGKIRAKQENPGDPYSPWIKICNPPNHPIMNEETVDWLFRVTANRHKDHNCLGYREIFREEDEKQPDGKVFRKLRQDNRFKWLTFSEADNKITCIAKGLMSLGIKKGDLVMIYAETRIEWFLSAMATFRLGAGIATLYATLGLEALVHGINETEVTHLVTTYDLLPKIAEIRRKLPRLKYIIYVEGPSKKLDAINLEGIQLITFDQVINFGKQHKEDISSSPVNKGTDTAVVMYTSGSTGIPKGVIITHKNLMSSVRGFYGVANELSPSECYMAYLPLAHVLELAAECFFLSMTIPIGYSSPKTMTDKSTAIKRGEYGDATILQPTVMAAVPLVLDRVKKAVLENLDTQGKLLKPIFSHYMEYKQFWAERGYETPIVNRIFCKKVKKLLGGRIKYIVCGSAPLSPDTHQFIRNVLGVTLTSGYGLTETAAGATLMDFDDLSVGRAGAPLYGLKLKLEDWAEGGYHPTDKPNPRGEILIGGDNVTAGYLRNPTLTQESYKEDGGVRWFRTGDIGEVHPDGVIKLIDRKKDLVKLQYGEYISLGKVETELKTCPIVDNICVYGDSLRDYLIAIVVPNERALINLAKQLKLNHLSYSQLCKEPAIISVVKKMFDERALQVNLNRTERPLKILLVEDEWTPDSGLVTAALKIRRKNIESRYTEEINKLYNIKKNGALSA